MSSRVRLFNKLLPPNIFLTLKFRIRMRIKEYIHADHAVLITLLLCNNIPGRRCLLMSQLLLWPIWNPAPFFWTMAHETMYLKACWGFGAPPYTSRKTYSPGEMPNKRNAQQRDEHRCVPLGCLLQFIQSAAHGNDGYHPWVETCVLLRFIYKFLFLQQSLNSMALLCDSKNMRSIGAE